MFTRGSAISTSSKPEKEAANNIYPRGTLCVLKRLSTDKSTHSLGVVCDEAGRVVYAIWGDGGQRGEERSKNPRGTRSLPPKERDREKE